MKSQKVEEGSKVASDRYRVVVSDDGPYLIYGRPPLAIQHIVTNDFGESWNFEEGEHFSTDIEPTPLCRCGASQKAPYCDGSHATHKWDSELTAHAEALLDNVDITVGEEILLTDNPKYCAFARFCDAGGGVWASVEASFDDNLRRMAIRQASLCPSGRMMIWSSEDDNPFERSYEPSLGLIEDDALKSSGPLWVRGGISIMRENGDSYEVRNRVTLCRCGESVNKPYCDGTHAAIQWQDGVSDRDTESVSGEKATKG